ncbi:MAG: RluA family pseudouridine synthase [Lentisphaerae bacterium]|nr:RluA family pseudouridine synthase [Lentisphaerota bacterium]
MIRKLVFEPAGGARRLDQFLADALPEQSRSYLQKLVKSGAVKVDDVIITVNKTMLDRPCHIYVELPELQNNELPAAEPFEFELLYEDEHMAVINKPPGVVVHPAPGNLDGTVVNAILSRYPELRSAELPDGSRPGIVHRLDKDTSGCLAIARTPEAQFKLGAAFAERSTRKTYLALTVGVPQERRGRIENLIGRHPVNRQKMAVVQTNGKTAISEYEVVTDGWLGKLRVALVRVRIYTGRTHQIRVHLAGLKTPVLGDEVYGGARQAIGVPRQMLHAWRLQIPHPISGEMIKVEAPLPQDFAELYRQLRTACSN